MLLMSGAVVHGSTYWNLGFGLDKGEVKKDAEALCNMQDLGETIAWLGDGDSAASTRRHGMQESRTGGVKAEG